MKNVFVLFLVGFLIVSCKTTKEVEEVVEERPTAEISRPAPQTMTRERRRGSVDPEQLAAQLGLSEDQEELFLDLWNTTTEAMNNVRRENTFDFLRTISFRRIFSLNPLVEGAILKISSTRLL